MLLAILLIAIRAGCAIGQAIVLPRPSGTYDVTVRTSQLTGFSRNDTDPGAPPGTPRSVMISAFLPVAEAPAGCNSRYMLSQVAKIESDYWRNTGPPNNPQNFSADFSRFRLPACSVDITYGAHSESYPMSKPGRFPVVFFSPGRGVSRFYYSATMQFLASTGFIVISVDHPYTVDAVKLPSGRLITTSRDKSWTYAESNRTVDIRASDLSFIANQLERNATFSRLLFPSTVQPSSAQRFGVWGHSFGGAAAAEVMLRDARFRGGINLDGTLFGRVADTGLDRPFVLWQGAEGHNRTVDTTWQSFWNHSTGWKRNIELANTVHLTFGDSKLLADTCPFSTVDFGSLGGLRTIQILAAYAHDFFSFALQGKGPGLLAGPNKAYPEVTFYS